MNSFGRLFQEDERDLSYPMSTVVPSVLPAVGRRYWNDTQWWGNQGSLPQCVAYAWLHWAEDGPVTHKLVAPPLYAPNSVYNRAQKIDEWPGENYDGTSVRAGAKVMQENGIISGYRWTWNAEVVASAILSTGPVVLGTKWYSDMSRPDKDGFIYATGNVVGGHAYVLNGVNVAKSRFRLKNSWGRNWGRNGRAWIGFNSIDRLLADQGEACLAIEVSG